MSDKVREQFEASVRDRGYSRVITPGGFYENRMVQEWWSTWLASRAAALEEAEDALRTRGPYMEPAPCPDDIPGCCVAHFSTSNRLPLTRDECIAVIRALAGREA